MYVCFLIFYPTTYSETYLQRPLPWETTAMTDHLSLVDGPTFQYNWTCHQKPPVLRDHIFMVNGLVFQDRFYCTLLTYTGLYRYYTLAPGPWNASSKSPRICWASSPFISVTLTRGIDTSIRVISITQRWGGNQTVLQYYILYYMKSASGRLLLAQV